MADDYINIFIGSLVLISFFVYYYFSIVRPPVLTCPSTTFKSFLKESMPVLSEKYWPTIWCYESRLLSSLQYFCRVNIHDPYEREILVLEDGGHVALDWLHTKDENACTPIILILPGILGDSTVPYVKRFVINAQECNFRCVVYNYRGLGNLELKTPRLYCMSDTTDLVQVVRRIRNRFPYAVLGACGVSMGALMLSHYLIKHADQREISVAMMNYVLFDVLGANEKMETGLLNPCINKFVTYNLRNIVARFRHVFDTDGSPWDVTEVLKSKTVKEFDDRLTCKMFGYSSAHEYYKEATLLDKMDKIKIPVLCLNAADDFGQPLEYSPDDDTPLFDSENLAIMITARGGHISHLEGLWPFRDKSSYMHRVFVQYFSAMFRNDSYTLFLQN